MKTMSQKQKTLVLFSGGKDSVFALYKALLDGYEPVLLSFVNKSDQVQFTDGPEIDHIFWQMYLSLFGMFESISIQTDGLDNSLAQKIQSISHENNIESIYTGDLGHPNGIDELLIRQTQLKVYTPGRSYVESHGKRAYIEYLISLGLVMPIISVRSDVTQVVSVGEILTVEYCNQLESCGVDCTGEDGEFQTIVTKCPLYKYEMQINAYLLESNKGRDDKNFEYKRMVSIEAVLK